MFCLFPKSSCIAASGVTFNSASASFGYAVYSLYINTHEFRLDNKKIGTTLSHIYFLPVGTSHICYESLSSLPCPSKPVPNWPFSQGNFLRSQKAFCAVGNDQNSVMWGQFPGGGCSIGPGCLLAIERHVFSWETPLTA
jgi:hypothetical protein